MLFARGGKGNGNRWDTQQITFRRGGNGAGINRVVAHVRPVVNARYHHVRQKIQQARDGHMHAVRRGAVDVIKTILRARQLERAIQGQGIARAAAIAFRRDDGDVRNCAQYRGQFMQTGGEIAIVITQQDAHQYWGRVAWNRAKGGKSKS